MIKEKGDKLSGQLSSEQVDQNDYNSVDSYLVSKFWSLSPPESFSQRPACLIVAPTVNITSFKYMLESQVHHHHHQ